MAEKYQFFDGKKFTRDDKTGYYLCSTGDENNVRKRMHVYVWEYFNGPISKGYHIHHIDGDKSNNDIQNLQMLSATEHERLQLSWRKNGIIVMKDMNGIKSIMSK